MEEDNLVHSTVDVLFKLCLPAISKTWVDEVWQTDFCEACDLPDNLLDGSDSPKSHCDTLISVLKVVETWSKCDADSQPLGNLEQF